MISQFPATFGKTVHVIHYILIYLFGSLSRLSSFFHCFACPMPAPHYFNYCNFILYIMFCRARSLSLLFSLLCKVFSRGSPSIFLCHLLQVEDGYCRHLGMVMRFSLPGPPPALQLRRDLILDLGLIWFKSVMRLMERREHICPGHQFGGWGTAPWKHGWKLRLFNLEM